MRPMTRGCAGWIALGLLVSATGGCKRQEPEVRATEPKATPQPVEQAAPAPAAPTPPEEPAVVKTTLECAISVAPNLPLGGPVELRFTLSNPMKGPAFVLNWRTPLEGMKGRDFEITRDGAEVPYQGPMVKRAAPTAENYVMLSPGGSVDATVDLSKAYDLSKPGKYRIAFRGELIDVAPDLSQVGRPMDKFQPMTVQCPAVDTVLFKQR